jgi:hypothetical protein
MYNIIRNDHLLSPTFLEQLPPTWSVNKHKLSFSNVYLYLYCSIIHKAHIQQDFVSGLSRSDIFRNSFSFPDDKNAF